MFAQCYVPLEELLLGVREVLGEVVVDLNGITGPGIVSAGIEGGNVAFSFCERTLAVFWLFIGSLGESPSCWAISPPMRAYSWNRTGGRILRS